MDMKTIEDNIVSQAMSYFTFMKEDEVTEDLVRLLVKSLEGEYKIKRNYPESYNEDMIYADMKRYFGMRVSNFAMKVIPDMFGRFGAEGQSMLVDNQIERTWVGENWLNDVIPFCEVI